MGSKKYTFQWALKIVNSLKNIRMSQQNTQKESKKFGEKCTNRSPLQSNEKIDEKLKDKNTLFRYLGIIMPIWKKQIFQKIFWVSEILTQNELQKIPKKNASKDPTGLTRNISTKIPMIMFHKSFLEII